MKYGSLLESLEEYGGIIRKAAKVDDVLQRHGLTNTEKNQGDGERTHTWSGPGDHKTIKSIAKALGAEAGLGHFYSSAREGTWMRNIHGEINPSLHQVVIQKQKGGTITATHSLPNKDRLSVAVRNYDHGDAQVHGYNEGSMHYRVATGPSAESVEAAHAHYAQAMGLGPKDVMDSPTTKTPVSGRYVKRWSHFRSDT